MARMSRRLRGVVSADVDDAGLAAHNIGRDVLEFRRVGDVADPCGRLFLSASPSYGQGGHLHA